MNPEQSEEFLSRSVDVSAKLLIFIQDMQNFSYREKSSGLQLAYVSSCYCSGRSLADIIKHVIAAYEMIELSEKTNG